MKTSDDIKKIVDKDMHIQVLRETLTDLRIENLFIKKVVLILFVMRPLRELRRRKRLCPLLS